jgi:hypothetical protein
MADRHRPAGPARVPIPAGLPYRRQQPPMSGHRLPLIDLILVPALRSRPAVSHRAVQLYEASRSDSRTPRFDGAKGLPPSGHVE